MLQRQRYATGLTSPVSPTHTRLDFQVYAKLGHGESIYVIGDAAAIGGSLDSIPKPVHTPAEAGQPVDGIALVTTPELFPVWYNPESIELPCSTNLLYKYCIFSGGKFVRYENILEPRSLVLKGLEMSTQDTLDELEGATDATRRTAIPIVPRLSTGQAFVDRHAVYGASEPERVGRRGSGRKLVSSSLATSTIPEEEESNTIETLEQLNINQKAVSIKKPLSPKSPRSLKYTNKTQSPPLIVQRQRGVSEETSQDLNIDSGDGVIIVHYSLPIHLHKNNMDEWMIEWDCDHLLCPSLNSWGKSSKLGSVRITWVGALRYDGILTAQDEEYLTKALQKFHCVPVFIDNDTKMKHHSYSYGTLRPVFHNVVDVYGTLPSRWWNPLEQKNAWSTYTNANRVFVDKVIEVYNEGDMIWIHGTHLLVAPSFISRRLPCANVGFFLHSPFPSSEIFRTLSVREDILRGILSADHIGFHLFEYARHFLTSCRRILGIKYSAQSGGYIGVEYNGRIVRVTISHTGIEPPLLDEISKKKFIEEKTKLLKEKYSKGGKKKIVIGMESVERLGAISLKFIAIEMFLKRYPEWIPNIHFIQIGVKNKDEESVRPKSVGKCRDDIMSMLNQVNSAYGTLDDPILTYIELEETNLSCRIPYWNISDVLINTCVREGANLDPFEFMYMKEKYNQLGVLILSEFCGSSRALTGAVVINPWKIDEVVDALEKSLTMSISESEARQSKDIQRILKNTKTLWAETILVDVKRSRKEKKGDYMGYGLGLGFRMLEFNAGFKRLEIDQVVKSYRSSFRRVLLFDYGNTLVNDAQHSGFRKYTTLGAMVNKEPPVPSKNVKSMLKVLCSDPRNTVFVLSGKEQVDMERILGDISGLGLAAEHGYFYRWGDIKRLDGSSEWLCTKDNYDTSWKDLTHAIMDIYTQRTHGTYCEIKGSALLWQYRDADPEFGQLQAKELQDQLTQVLENFNVDVLMGGDYVEVRPEGVDKGVMVDRIISTIESTDDNYVDFILCIGDDNSDEFMFSYLQENRPRPKLFTCTVGKKPSAAQYFVNGVDEVLEMLGSIIKVSTASNRNLSMNDLRSFETHEPISRNAYPPIMEETTNNHSFGPLTLKSKYSMSMVSLSSSLTSADGAEVKSSTLEQYFSNIEEGEEEDQGGIFF